MVRQRRSLHDDSSSSKSTADSNLMRSRPFAFQLGHTPQQLTPQQPPADLQRRAESTQETTQGNHFNFADVSVNAPEQASPSLTRPSVDVQQTDAGVKIQRDVWSTLSDFWQSLLDRQALHQEIKTLLGTKPVDVNKILTLIRKSDADIRRSLYDYPYTRMKIIEALSGEDLVRVMSTILDSTTYTPGWESDYYRGMPSGEKNLINEKVDRWFKYETGIERSLDPSSAVDRPLVRHWLGMRDVIIESEFKGEIEDDKKKQQREERYNKYLREAIDKMQNVGFGSALDMPALGASSKERYPFKYWQLETDKEFASDRPQQGMLVYNNLAANPAYAVDELFTDKNLARWTLDCAEFIQVAHLYARRHTLGDIGFMESIQQSGEGLKLRIHHSTGYRAEHTYQRNKPNEPMALYAPGRPPSIVDTDINELLEQAPVSSRIVWRNRDVSPSHDFYNENTIKVGPDTYAAQGIEGKKYFTREELETKMAEISYRKDRHGNFESYKNSNIFIRTIEHISLP
jgi:hypothetical protein